MIRARKGAETEVCETVEAILLLHSFAVSAADIARRLHLNQATVLAVIKTGELPKRQQLLAWKDSE